ncbi:MAG: hypothetical protein ACAH07_09580 [Methylophilaceae bacterium]|nr:hypothetical protein [Methyloradius sp.]
MTFFTRLSIIIFLTLNTFISGGANSEEAKVSLIKHVVYDNQGNKIIYEAKNSETENQNLYGEIEIYKKNNELIYMQKYVATPGCLESEFSKPKFLENNQSASEQILVACGDDGGAGNHNVLFFIKNGKVIGNLEIGANSLPSIVWIDENKTFQTYALYRKPSQFQGLDSFLIVYQWDRKNWFQPVFNSYALKEYFGSYLRNKKLMNDRLKEQPLSAWKDVVSNPALAALAATSDKKLICSELKTLPFSKFSKTDIQSTFSFNTKYGYPNINIADCGVN